jgi:hypothetical protein
MVWGRRNGRAGGVKSDGPVQLVAQGNLPPLKVIQIRNSVAPGILAAGLLAGEIDHI